MMIEISIGSLIAICIASMGLGINVYRLIEMLILKWFDRK